MTSMLKRKVAQVPCPHCGYEYSRPMHAQPTPQGYRRKRACEKCKRWFVTYERAATEKKEKTQ